MGPYPAKAGDEPEVLMLAGAEISPDASYAYVGRLSPLPGSSFGHGLVNRLWLDWSSYRYKKNNITYEASVPGLEAALGYQHAESSYWWSAFGGLIYNSTSLSPHDPESSSEGSQVRAKVQLEAEKTIDQIWKLSGNGSYILGQEAYWTRARLARHIASNHYLGLEAICQGDPGYQLTQVGIFMYGIRLSDTVGAGLKIGARQVKGLSSRPYLGVEFSF